MRIGNENRQTARDLIDRPRSNSYKSQIAIIPHTESSIIIISSSTLKTNNQDQHNESTDIRIQ